MVGFSQGAAVAWELLKRGRRGVRFALLFSGVGFYGSAPGLAPTTAAAGRSDDEAARRSSGGPLQILHLHDATEQFAEDTRQLCAQISREQKSLSPPGSAVGVMCYTKNWLGATSGREIRTAFDLERLALE